MLVDKFQWRPFVRLLQAKMLERIKKHDKSLSLVGALAAPVAPVAWKTDVDGIASRQAAVAVMAALRETLRCQKW
jgi:hypothetical protein